MLMTELPTYKVIVIWKAITCRLFEFSYIQEMRKF